MEWNKEMAVKVAIKNLDIYQIDKVCMFMHWSVIVCVSVCVSLDFNHRMWQPLCSHDTEHSYFITIFHFKSHCYGREII